MANYDIDSAEVAALLKAAVVPFNFNNFFPSAEYMWQQSQPKSATDKQEPKSYRLMRLWDQMVTRPGAFIPETNKILIKPDLPRNILVTTVAHESVHFLKANGMIARDVPLASAWGYYKRWTFEQRNPTSGGGHDSAYLKQDNWSQVLTGIADGRILARSDSVARQVDGILAAYDETQEEDELSYRWGALIAGIAIELNLGPRYLSELAKGSFHNDAVEAATAKGVQ